MWVGGILTGHNYANRSQQVSTISSGTVEQHITRYCKSQPREQGTVSGAAIGAAAGAGIAAISGGNGWTGAAIGGIVGGTVGNLKGKQQQ